MNRLPASSVQTAATVAREVDLGAAALVIADGGITLVVGSRIVA